MAVQDLEGGTCLVAEVDGKIVGTVTYHRFNPWASVEWYDGSDVAQVGQFAVEPEFQRSGIGSALMNEVERIALADGAAELALNTAEPATHLIDYYIKRGYRIVEWTDASQPHYRSVIMSKTLRNGGG